MAQGALAAIATELGAALLPLGEALASPNGFRALMIEVGFDIRTAPPAVAAIATLVDDVETALQTVENASVAADLAPLLDAIKSALTAIQALEGMDFSAIVGAGAEFAKEFPRQVLDYTIIRYLRMRWPRIAYALQAFGLLRTAYSPRGARPDFVRWTVAWEDVPLLLTNPAKVFVDAYGWGTASFDDRLFLGNVGALLLANKVVVYNEPMPAHLAQALDGLDHSRDPAPRRLVIPLFSGTVASVAADAGLRLFALRSAGGSATSPGLALLPYLTGGLAQSFSLDNHILLTVDGSLDIQGGLALTLRPGGLQVQTGFGGPGSLSAASGELETRIDYQHPSSTPVTLLGDEAGTRIDAMSVSGTAGLRLATGATVPDLYFELEIDQGRLVIAAGAGDPFLQKLLPPDGLVTGFELALGLSSQRGFYFRGSAGLQATLPVHLSVGPLTVESVAVSLLPTTGGLALTAGAMVDGQLGPVAVSIEGLGVAGTFTLPGSGGNLGPLDIQVGFQPPTGLGLSVDAGPVVGGGFISFDEKSGRYSGALQLDVFGIGVQALGLLETKLPQGGPSYSFIVLVSAEFTPIELGLGFTLNGVGGIAGVNRTVATDVLQAAVRNHTVDHILFPKDVVKDAPQILSDLGTFFPPADGRYVFCPMALIGWGTPTVVTAEVALLVELPPPMRLGLIGEVSAYLPSPESPTVEIHVDVLALLDLPGKLFSLDASLHDSHIGQATLVGDLAVRYSWADPPEFVFSLGGFNPAFKAPAGFPTLRRLALDLGGTDPSLHLESYFALTSNTLQLGSNIALAATAGPFGLTAQLGFDALFTFKPFSFDADISGAIALSYDGSTFAGIHLDASLSGPSPWHVKGDVCLSLFLFSVCAGFEATFGEAGGDSSTAPDPTQLLTTALGDPRSWSGELVPGALAVAKLAAPEGAKAPARMDPAAGARLLQRVVPLGRQIFEFGGQPLATPLTFTVDPTATLNGSAVSDVTAENDYFARAQFESLTNADKLSAPSFESMQAGATVGAGGFAIGSPVSDTLAYRTVVLDGKWQRKQLAGSYKPKASTVAAQAAWGPAAGSALHRRGLARFAPAPGSKPLVSLTPERYVVAQVADLARRDDVAAPGEKGAVLAALATYMAAHPRAQGTLQVIPESEAPARAAA
jgi:hypothetical protein